MFFKFLTYNKFKLKKWSRLSYSQRLKYCQKLERIEAKTLKRAEYQIVIKDMDDLNLAGRCVSSQNQLLIDDNYIKEDDKRFELMCTIFHEGRHAFQFEKINSKKKHSIFSKAYWWKKNLEGYVNNSECGDKQSFYAMQPVELDANNYALKRLKSFKFRFRKEPDYYDTTKYYEARIEKREQQARKELGIFYKIKIAWRNYKERKKK